KLRALLRRPGELEDEALSAFEGLFTDAGQNVKPFWEEFKRSFQTYAAIRRGIPHEILNAKNHAREAAIVAQAGRKHAVTIATNRAGRGPDITLGGTPEGLAKAEAGPPPLRSEGDTDEVFAQKLAEHQKNTEEAHQRLKVQCAAERE